VTNCDYCNQWLLLIIKNVSYLPGHYKSCFFFTKFCFHVDSYTYFLCRKQKKIQTKIYKSNLSLKTPSPQHRTPNPVPFNMTVTKKLIFINIQQYHVSSIVYTIVLCILDNWRYSDVSLFPYICHGFVLQYTPLFTTCIFSRFATIHVFSTKYAVMWITLFFTNLHRLCIYTHRCKHVC